MNPSPANGNRRAGAIRAAAGMEPEKLSQIVSLL